MTEHLKKWRKSDFRMMLVNILRICITARRRLRLQYENPAVYADFGDFPAFSHS